jgi:hypothetical protein
MVYPSIPQRPFGLSKHKKGNGIELRTWEHKMRKTGAKSAKILIRFVLFAFLPLRLLCSLAGGIRNSKKVPSHSSFRPGFTLM